MTKPALWMKMKPKVMKKRKPLRRRSKVMSGKMVQYHVQRMQFLLKMPWCAACLILGKLPPKQSKDIHHYAGKVGPNLLDMRGWLAVCRPCHHWITDNPSKARKLGLICPIGKWNHPIQMP